MVRVISYEVIICLGEEHCVTRLKNGCVTCETNIDGRLSKGWRTSGSGVCRIFVVKSSIIYHETKVLYAKLGCLILRYHASDYAELKYLNISALRSLE